MFAILNQTLRVASRSDARNEMPRAERNALDREIVDHKSIFSRAPKRFGNSRWRTR